MGLVSPSSLFLKTFEEIFESMWTQTTQEHAKIYYTYRP